MSSIADLGWDEFFESQISEEERSTTKIGRIVEDHRGLWRVDGEFDGLAEAGGRLRHEASTTGVMPAVGDWATLSHEGSANRAVIRRILTRRTTLSRAASGTTIREQVIAANVDTIFVVTSFNQDLSANRLERYLAVVWEAGALPVVVVNKADLCADVESSLGQLRARVPFVDVHAVSAQTSGGLDPLEAHLMPRRTVGLVGSSGVGKSSIVNRLVGRDILDVSAIRESDGKGRHTTTSRHLVQLPGGALLIDTPGMRELQPWDPASGLNGAFSEIADLAAGCRFSDCTHVCEPGCAVLAAVEGGQLHPERLENYRRMTAAATYEVRKHDKAASAEVKRRWKHAMRAQRAMDKDRDR
jgi:ribosome biogenesis GTPase